MALGSYLPTCKGFAQGPQGLRPRALSGASRADDGGTGARAERGERAVAPACMPRLPVPRGGLGAGVTLGGMPSTAGGGGWAPMH